MAGPPEHAAKQQARPGLLEGHGQPLMVDESAFEQLDGGGSFAAGGLQQAVAARGHDRRPRVMVGLGGGVELPGQLLRLLKAPQRDQCLDRVRVQPEDGRLVDADLLGRDEQCAEQVVGGRWKVAGHQLRGAEAPQVQRHRRHEADGLVRGEVTLAQRPRFPDAPLMGQGQHVHRGRHGSADPHPLGVIPALRGQRDGEARMHLPSTRGRRGAPA